MDTAVHSNRELKEDPWSRAGLAQCVASNNLQPGGKGRGSNVVNMPSGKHCVSAPIGIVARFPPNTGFRLDVVN